MREFYEAKLGAGELTVEDFGQLANYLMHAPGLRRGMLFNARHMWLYEADGGAPRRLIKAELGARGSRALLRGFFDDPARPLPEPPLLVLLRALMRELAVVPCEAAPGAGAFLGAGASGRVFAVRRAGTGAGAPPLALKASHTASRADLTYEFDRHVAAAAAGAPVVPIIADSLRFAVDAAGCHAGGGYLLRDVLSPFEATSAQRCAAAFGSLRALHVTGFVHGDARLPNLLAAGSRAPPLWIDMRAAAAGGTQADARRADARTLAESILGLPHAAALPPDVAEALAAVAPGGGCDYSTLAVAVADARLVAAA